MATQPDNAAHGEAIYLSHLKKGDIASVTGMADSEGAEQTALKRRLLELGFAAGETIRIVAESFPQRDPIAVRLGNTTFALRRHEASMIRVVRARNAA
jgi:ferrous iron transport protein A